MTQVKPPVEIKCCDWWQKDTLTPVKMEAYKRLIARGEILIVKVTHHKPSMMTQIEYLSGLPHQWVLEKLRDEAQQIIMGQQMHM